MLEKTQKKTFYDVKNSIQISGHVSKVLTAALAL